MSASSPSPSIFQPADLPHFPTGANRLRTIEPHPEHFAKLKVVLERFAAAKLYLTGFRNELAAVGIVGDRSKKPLALGSVVRVLHNPFYYGVFAHKGELHQGTHVPMISKKTFDEIQKALVIVGRPRHHRDANKFLFLNFATCDVRGYSITAERHTKKSGLRFNYYRCTHKDKTCTARSYIRQEQFAAEVKRNAELVTLPDEWKEKFLARIETWETETSHEKLQKIALLKSDLSALKARIDRISNGFADGAIDIAEFKELKNPLMPQKAALEEQITVLERSRTNRLEPLRKWVFEANKAKTAVSNDNWLEMKSFLEKVGSNRLLRAQTLTVSFIKPFDSLAETTLSVRSTPDFSTPSSGWWRIAVSNR